MKISEYDEFASESEYNQEAKIRAANLTTIYLQFTESKKENKKKEFYPER